jgi:N-acetylglucosamine kinase-like BadF-type ATPase
MLQYLVEKLPKHTDLIDRSTLSKKIVEMIKATLILSIVLFFMSASYGQSAIEYFNAAANQYIYESDQLALNTIDQGLQSYPADQNLATLREKIMKEQEQKEKPGSAEQR